MGTNYYFHDKEPCKCCNRQYPSRHIGKSSSGWCFGLHVYPEDNINTLEDWKKLFETGRIIDEYGDEIKIKKMLDIITNRQGNIKWDTDWAIKSGYKSEEHFHDNNYSMRGPNNLLRHKIMNNHCIGHGEGTWDYIIGEFS